MARALGGPQTSGLPLVQNGLQNLSGVGNDPLTQYLGKMSREQLNEIMSEMKALAVQNKVLAQQLLQGCPQLSKAPFQVRIMLGMVTPQTTRMANSGQSSSSVRHLAIQNSIPNQNSLPPSHPCRMFLQKESFVGPLVRPPESQETLCGQFGITTQQQNVGNLSNQPQVQPLPTSNNLISQVTLPGVAVVVHRPQPFLPDSQQQSYLPHPMTSQSGPANYPVLPNGANSLSKEAGTLASTVHDSAWASRGSIQSDATGLVPGSQIANADVLQHSEKQMPQLPPEVESALLQQVMNSAPEQLSSLPLEQRQQVLQLQQMLVEQNL